MRCIAPRQRADRRMKGARKIFRFLLEALQRGEQAVLVTLTDVAASSSREPGTHMAVSSTGAFIGSFSGGCVEAAVVAEALAVLKRGTAEIIRFGAGSRYIDIRLPCGGGIDLLFTPNPAGAALAEIVQRLDARCAATIALTTDGDFRVFDGPSNGWSEFGFTVTHQPDLQLVIVGHGSETVALARQAAAYEAHVRVMSPDAATLAAVDAFGVEGVAILTPASTDALVADRRTAIAFLFHDHDWEPALMIAALATPAFFIGAMGSERTHALRCEHLAMLGVASPDVARIVGPIGSIPATRDPDTLAVSVLAQIVAEFESPPIHEYIPPNIA